MTGPGGHGRAAERSLPEKVVAIHRALARVDHAFGGALALAYYAEPRATHDIDLNVFVPASRARGVTEALGPLGVAPTRETLAHLERDGQGRVWVGRTPLDLFFAYDPFHEAARRGARTVPFADTEIPVLSATHLAVCKAVFDRPKDWVDIDAMLDQDTAIDAAEALRWVGRIAGDTDRRYDRLAAVLTTPR
jgi:hypothetical protein